MVDFKELRQKNIELTKQAVKEAVSKDLLIVQTVNSIEELTTITNMLVNRVREWYGYYNPEFIKATDSNEEIVQNIAKASKSKDSLGEDIE